ncbi:hypothetical protein PMAYCL1PPCAC_16470, partial [Pristionchus mayeri]
LYIYLLVISTTIGVVGAVSDASWIEDDSGGCYPQLHQSERGKMLFGGLLTFSIVFILVISCSYTIAYVKLRKLLQIMVTGDPKDKSERTLTYIALLTCAIEVFYYVIFAYVFIIAHDVESDPRTFYFILAIQGNLSSGIHTYLLLAFSDMARKAAKQCL